MIVEMKKLSLITLTADVENTLGLLRTLGVMHLDIKRGNSESLSALTDARALAQRALLILPDKGTGSPANAAGWEEDPSSLIRRILEIQNTVRDLYDELERLQREKSRLSAWGDFSPQDIVKLREKGIDIRLYILTKEQFESLDSSVQAFTIQKGKTAVYVVVVGEALAGAAETSLPSAGISEVRTQIDKVQTQIGDLSTEFNSLAAQKHVVQGKIDSIDTEMEFEQAKLSMDADSGISHIDGYVPEPQVRRIKSAASSNGWALMVRDPEDDDPVPTLVKNPKPVGIIAPIFKMLGTIPGYAEYDISFWFLVFFALFFAMIIGDGGYGAIFLGVSVTAIITLKAKGKKVGRELALLTFLSCCTIVWGAITGTWLGSPAIAEAMPFRLLIIPAISSFNPRSSQSIKYICFIIGTIQILLAHIWNFIAELRKKPRIKAFAQIGWMAIVYGIYFLVLNLVLDPDAYPLPPFALWLILGGLGLVVIFSEQQGKFFIGIGRGFASLFTTLLDGIGAFADIISYIRLFAVGLATIEIAKAFNQMAADMGNSIVGLVGAIFVLIVGHGLNIAMGALSVIVHGVRLNMLEFSGHLGMEWTGIQYAPFSEGTELQKDTTS
ncbi:MAG: ATPase V [Spirochaetales bacterium]|nr:ATPase V [Spirochaetales bacterium]